MGDLLGAHAVHIYLSVHGSHGSLVNGTVQLGEDLGQSGIRLDQIGIYEVYSVVGGEEAQVVLQSCLLYTSPSPRD